MKLGMFGSRTLSGHAVKEIIAAEVKKHDPEYVVTSGGIDGVCNEVESYCKHNGLAIKLHYPNKERYGRGMYDARSKAIIRESDHVVLIHDGKSPGTKHELALVCRLSKPYTYHRVETGQSDMALEISAVSTAELEGKQERG